MCYLEKFESIGISLGIEIYYRFSKIKVCIKENAILDMVRKQFSPQRGLK